MSSSIYLDNNATTHLSPRVKQRLHELIEQDPGNPESPHSGAENARALVSDARLKIADAMSVQEEQVIFTASGSESNTFAVHNAVHRYAYRRPVRVLTTRAEHSSVTNGLETLASHGADVYYVSLKPSGEVDLDDLRRAAVQGADAIFVQWANNETGVIQPISEVSSIAAELGAYLHVDGAQAFGRIRLPVGDLQIDSVTITAHKIHGPKGIAAVIVRRNTNLAPSVFGGQQEFGLRGGTHNVLGIGGFDTAVRDRFENFEKHVAKLRSLRDQLERDICEQLRSVRVQSVNASRVPNTTCITFPGADGAQLVARLDAQGVLCSQTSACRSNRPEPSAVLTAMGLSEDDAYATIRFSVSVLNTEEEMSRASSLICGAYRHFVA